MISAKIKFNKVSDVADFVSRVSKFDTDVDIKYRTALLDGKSIEGLYAIQLGTELTCIIHDNKNNAQELITEIQDFCLTEFE